MHYKLEFVILSINGIGRKLENYRGRIGSDCQVYHSLHLRICRETRFVCLVVFHFPIGFIDTRGPVTEMQ